jgi:hypothetical protein
MGFVRKKLLLERVKNCYCSGSIKKYYWRGSKTVIACGLALLKIIIVCELARLKTIIARGLARVKTIL